jgi:hypothetical protein
MLKKKKQRIVFSDRDSIKVIARIVDEKRRRKTVVGLYCDCSIQLVLKKGNRWI